MVCGWAFEVANHEKCGSEGFSSMEERKDRSLRFIKKLLVLSVAFFFQIFFRDKTQSGRVDAIAQACRFRPIIKDMPQVRVSALATDFRPGHKQVSILF